VPITIETEQRRDMLLEYVQPGEDSSLLELSFSSEYPVERYFGLEILDHSPGAVDLSRVERGACPLLLNHDQKELIGKVERAWVDPTTRKGRAVVRFDTRGDSGDEALQQVKDGILLNVSCFYKIRSHREEYREGKSTPVVTVTNWELVEISLVSCPEDPTVGIGRSISSDKPAYQAMLNPTARGQGKVTDNEDKFDADQLRAEIKQQETDRIRNISAMPSKWGSKIPGGVARAQQIADEAIQKGISEQEARNLITDEIFKQETQSISRPAPKLDLSDNEQKEYSLLRAVHAHLEKDWSKAGFELECSRAIAKETGGSPHGFYVPIKDLKVDPISSRRAMQLLEGIRTTYNTGTAAAAGNLVSTILDAGSFIDILRNKPRVMQAGARMLTGLIGNLDIPRQNGSGTVYWVAEGSGPTDSNATFDKISFSPKTLGVLTSMTRLMMIQSTPDIEMLARQDIANIISLEIDRVGLDGSGASNQPRGILNTSGITAVSLGTNGGAITYDAIIDLETAVATANADDANLSYMTNPRVVGNLKKLKTTTGEYLWNGTDNGLTPGTPGSINGYPVFRTNQMPANKTKGSGTGLSTAIFGDWSQLMYANWGVLDILPNPYGSGYSAGNVEIRALQSMDLQIRHKESFSLLVDILTS
jgi:HK97 family phage major capsid protein